MIHGVLFTAVPGNFEIGLNVAAHKTVVIFYKQH